MTEGGALGVEMELTNRRDKRTEALKKYQFIEDEEKKA
jgi:hypothetical protein